VSAPIREKIAKQDGRRELASELHAMLFPEQHPEGDPFHDPDHLYWSSGNYEYDSCFQWSSDVVGWVAERVESELKET
jgi:hypothetical protein